MLYSEIIAVCSEIHKKHINTLCGQNVEFVNVKPGGAQSKQQTLATSLSLVFLHCQLLTAHNSSYF
jgi:hypothetical protein